MQVTEEKTWIDLNSSQPEPYEEVLVWVDGHRSASWRNNYALVAYMDDQGEWRQERYPSLLPLQGVLYWQPISLP